MTKTVKLADAGYRATNSYEQRGQIQPHQPQATQRKSDPLSFGHEKPRTW